EEHAMARQATTVLGWIAAVAAFGVPSTSAATADVIHGRVTGAGAPIAGSTVTLWLASDGAPRQGVETRSGADGRLTLSAAGGEGVLYLVAKGGQAAASKTSGDNPAIALLSVVGGRPPANVAINEMTTIASVWTHNQFIEGTAIQGPALSLGIAAGNVP